MPRATGPKPLLHLPRRSRRRIVAAGALLSLAAVAVAWRPPRILEHLEGKVYDTFLRAAPAPGRDAAPVIVDIDEESLARHGQWPWPRYRVARLLERVAALGATAVGVDMVFAEPDRTSLATLAREIERDLGVRLAVEDPGGRTDNDRTLADTLAAGPFVLGYAFAFHGERPSADCVLHPLQVELRGLAGVPGEIFGAEAAVCNIPRLAAAAPSSGFFNLAPDHDGTIRRLPLLARYRDQLYPGLALALALQARADSRLSLSAGDDGALALGGLGGRAVPLDTRGNLLLRFRGGRGSFPYLSAAAVLDGSTDPDALRGRVAIVGTSAAGLKDLHATPLDPAFPGPEVHAVAVDTLLRGTFLRHPPAARLWELLAALGAGALTTLVLARAGAFVALPLLAAASAALWGGALWLFAGTGLLVSPLVPQAVLAANFALLSFLRFRASEREAADFSRKLGLTQDVIIQSMAALAETRDNETGGHIQRTRHYVRALAEQLRGHPRFKAFLDDQTIELLFRLAPLHDIGKVGVRDYVLLKPSRLTREEFEEMKRHTIYGDDTLEVAERRLGDDSFLQIAREFALTHQEKWDGSGYPRGLAGDRIPIAGRLMAVADVYDALVSRRVYKEPMSHEGAAAILVQGRGTHFDPDVIDAFLALEERFKAISARFADPCCVDTGEEAGARH